MKSIIFESLPQEIVDLYKEKNVLLSSTTKEGCAHLYLDPLIRYLENLLCNREKSSNDLKLWISNTRSTGKDNILCKIYLASLGKNRQDRSSSIAHFLIQGLLREHMDESGIGSNLLKILYDYLFDLLKYDHERNGMIFNTSTSYFVNGFCSNSDSEAQESVCTLLKNLIDFKMEHSRSKRMIEGNRDPSEERALKKQKKNFTQENKLLPSTPSTPSTSSTATTSTTTTTTTTAAARGVMSSNTRNLANSDTGNRMKFPSNQSFTLSNPMQQSSTNDDDNNGGNYNFKNQMMDQNNSYECTQRNEEINRESDAMNERYAELEEKYEKLQKQHLVKTNEFVQLTSHYDSLYKSYQEVSADLEKVKKSLDDEKKLNTTQTQQIILHGQFLNRLQEFISSNGHSEIYYHAFKQLENELKKIQQSGNIKTEK